MTIAYRLDSALRTLLLLSLFGIEAAAQAPAKPPTGVTDRDCLILDLQGNGIDLSGTRTERATPSLDAPAKMLTWRWPKASSGNGFLAVDTHALEQAHFEVRSMMTGETPPGNPSDRRIRGNMFFEWKMARKDKAHWESPQRPGVWNGLASLDTDHDGTLDPADPAWPCLSVWVDRDGDGVMQANEAMGLAQAGVKAITVPAKDPYADVKQDEDGDWRLDGEFTAADGKKHVAAAVAFVPTDKSATNEAADSASPGAAASGDILVLDIQGKGIDLSGTLRWTRPSVPASAGGGVQKWIWPKADSGDAILLADWRALADAHFDGAASDAIGYCGPGRPQIFTGSNLLAWKREVEGKHLSNWHQRGPGVWNNLRVLDTNNDGVLDCFDAAWAALQAWVDKDGDGEIQKEEVQDLPHAGVRQITVPKADPYKDMKRNDDGTWRLDGEIIMQDGSKHVAAAVVLSQR